MGAELLNVPFPEMVLNLATAIAEAQYKMDLESIEVLRLMGEEDTVTIPTPDFIAPNGESRNQITTSMLGAGFQPTFYQFAETIIEVKMAITITEEREEVEEGQIQKVTGVNVTTYRDRRGRIILSRRTLRTTPMDAKYTNKYSFTQEGESTLRTRLVPVPPNTLIQRFIDLKAQEMELKIQAELGET